jgi:hypothetical protein
MDPQLRYCGFRIEGSSSTTRMRKRNWSTAFASADSLLSCEGAGISPATAMFPKLCNSDRSFDHGTVIV